MSFDYVSDQFGEYRGSETRYTPIEKEAIKIINEFYNDEIESNEFADRMFKVRDSILRLDKKNENGNIIIDQNTPLWIMNFLAFKFLKWNDYRVIQEAAKSNPELTNDPRWPSIIDGAHSFDIELREAMTYCLDEWKRIHSSSSFSKR